MPKITDPGELELVKKIYGFIPPVLADNLTEEERAERYNSREKNTKNQAV